MNKNTRQHNKSKKRRNSITINLTIVCIVIFAILVLLWLLRFDLNAKYDRQATFVEVSQLLDSIRSPGSTVFNEVQDTRCAQNDSGLETYVHCEIVGNIFFKNSDDLATDLHGLNEKLNILGFNQDLLAHQKEANIKAALEGNEFHTAISYRHRDSQNMTARISFYETPEKSNGYLLRSLIGDKISTPSENEYIYGVTINFTYYACRSGTFHIPCPQVPK